MENASNRGLVSPREDCCVFRGDGHENNSNNIAHVPLESNCSADKRITTAIDWSVCRSRISLHPCPRCREHQLDWFPNYILRPVFALSILLDDGLTFHPPSHTEFKCGLILASKR